MSPDVPSGRFVWYELMTSDPAAARIFYTKLTGWKTQPWDAGPTPYTMWMNGDTSVGGVMQLPDEARQQGAPPHWLAYITTPNVDDTVTNASNRGGRLLHGPMDIPTVGTDRRACRSARGGVRRTHRGGRGARTRRAVAGRRVLLARARDDRPRSGVRVLQWVVRVGEDRRDGHGPGRDVSDVRAGRKTDPWAAFTRSRPRCRGLRRGCCTSTSTA